MTVIAQTPAGDVANTTTFVMQIACFVHIGALKENIKMKCRRLVQLQLECMKEGYLIGTDAIKIGCYITVQCKHYMPG